MNLLFFAKYYSVLSLQIRMLLVKCKLISLIKLDVFYYVFVELRLIKILGKLFLISAQKIWYKKNRQYE